MIETIVDRLVIRGDDPREPHASESGMKLRALAVAITPALVTLAIAAVLEAPDAITFAAPIAVLVVAVRAVSGPINERIEELEATDTETDRACIDCGETIDGSTYVVDAGRYYCNDCAGFDGIETATGGKPDR